MQFANIEELFLQRLDKLDDMTRKILQIAAVLGFSFSCKEIIGTSKQVLSVSAADHMKHSLAVRRALAAAAKEGIIDKTVEDDETVDGAEDQIFNMTIDLAEDEDDNDADGTRCLNYNFYHDTWRRLVLSLLLGSWKRDIHKHAAMSIEAEISYDEIQDYRTKIKLFRHWKDSESTLKAATIGLDIGKSFILLGMSIQSIKIFEDALEMWKRHKPAEGKELVAGKSALFVTGVLAYLFHRTLLLIAFSL